MAPTILMMSASVGAGHDGVAAELTRRLRSRGFAVRRVDFADALPARVGPLLRNAYAAQLRFAPGSWDWLLARMHQHTVASRVPVGVVNRLAATRAHEWLAEPLVAAVSTYPIASQFLGYLRRTGRLTVPVATFLTDMSVHPLWVAEGVNAHLALHDLPADQARRRGAAGVVVAGAVTAPAYRPAADAVSGSTERAEVRDRYGIARDQPAALVVAGSWGVGEVAETVRDIAATGLAVPVTVCGNNTALRERIERLDCGPTLGWVDQLAPLLRAADLVVQNAGGLTSLEALACGVPVISYRCLPGHGTTNCQALHESGLAGWARDVGELPKVLAAALSATAHRTTPTGRDPVELIVELAGGAPVPASAAAAAPGTVAELTS